MSITFPRRDTRTRAATAAERDTIWLLPVADFWAVLGLLALTAIVSAVRLHYDIWIGRTDLLTAYLPGYAFLGDQLRSFDIPGWSPFQASGLPFAGDPQSGWMYLPVMVFYSFLSPVAATKAMVVFNLALASLSTYAFARVLGLRPVGGLVSAVSFGFGAMVYQTTGCCTIWSQLSPWLPLGFLGIELSVRRETWRGRFIGWSLTAFAVSQMMAGWMGQGVYNAALLLGAYLVYRTLLSPPAGSPAIRDRLTLAVVSGAAILILGLGLSAAGLLPRLDANRSSQLAGGEYSEIETGGETGWRPVTVVHHLLDTSDSNVSRRFYVGGVTFALAILALLVARRRHAVPFFAGVALVIPLMVLHDSPLHPIYSLLPRYEDLHEHSKFRLLSVYYLAPAMLAGATVDTLGPWLRRRGSALAALVPVLLVLTAIWFVDARFDSGTDDSSIGRGALFGTLAVSLILLFGIALHRFGSRWHSAWPERLLRSVPLLLLLVLLWEPTGHQLTEGGYMERTNGPARQAGIEANLAETDPGGAGEFIQQQLRSAGEPFRYFGYDAAGLRTFVFEGGALYHDRRIDPGIYSLLTGAQATRLRIYNAQGYNPIQSSLYAEYLTALNRGVRQDYHDANILTSGFDSRLINLLNIRYIIVPHDTPPGRPDLLRLSQLHPTVFDDGQVRVLENRNALPHAWITHEVREAGHGEMLGMLDSGVVDPRLVTLVEQGQTPGLPMEGAADDHVQVVDYEPDSMTLRTASTGNGMLVVSEIFTPGWNAYLDGEEVPIQGVNYLFRGIPLPAGEHTVEIRYEPRALTLGVAATSATAAGIIAVFALAYVLPARRTLRR